MGTFPPKPLRWSMEFYYPNRINDFWRIMGLIFFNDRNRFINPDDGSFLLTDIKRFLIDKGIALSDTGRAVRRLRDNASDKYLEIVETCPLEQMLAQMPSCRHVATTGEKAASVIAEITSTPLPAMGQLVTTQFAGRELVISRLPSTSRAYPLAIDKKAAYYKQFLIEASCLTL